MSLLIQSAVGSTVGSVHSISVTLPSPVTKGNTLVVVFTTGRPGLFPLNPISDSQGNSWPFFFDGNSLVGANSNLAFTTAGATGAVTITLTAPTIFSGVNVCIAEYNLQNPALDVTSGFGFASPYSTTTTKSPSLVLSVNSDSNAGSVFGVDNGFVVDVSNSNSDTTTSTIGLASKSLPGIGAVTINWSGEIGTGCGSIFSIYNSIPPITIGTTRYGVKTFLQPQPGNSIPYRLCVNNNRLYCVLPDNTGIFSCFVYYLGRENNQGGYWYRYVIDPAALISEEDGTLFGGFGDGGVGSLFTLDVSNVLQFAGTNINVNLLFPQSKNEINQRKDVYHLRFHVDTGNTPLTLTGYTDFGAASAFALGTITTSGVQEINLLIQNTNFNLAKRFAIGLSGATPFFKMVDWSIDYENRPEPLSFLRIATNYSIAAKKRIRTIPIVIDTRGNAVNINVTVDGVAYGDQSFTTSDRTTVFYYFNTDVFATDLVINITATNGNTFEYYDAPAPVNVEILPVGKLFDQIGPVELERIGALLEFRVRMLATTDSLTYNVYMDDIAVVTAQTLTVTPNVDRTYGPFKMPKGIQGSVCRVEFLSSNGVFYRWNCKLKFTTGGVKSDTKQITIQDKVIGLQS